VSAAESGLAGRHVLVAGVREPGRRALAVSTLDAHDELVPALLEVLA
jgi:hypothetical protein